MLFPSSFALIFIPYGFSIVLYRYNELKGNSSGENDSKDIIVVNDEIDKANDDLSSVQEILDGINTWATHAER